MNAPRPNEERVIKPKTIVDYLRAMQADPKALYDDAIYGMAADEIERLRAVLDWMLRGSGCHVWHGSYSQRLSDTPEPLRAIVAAEINAYRAMKGVAPL